MLGAKVLTALTLAAVLSSRFDLGIAAAAGSVDVTGGEQPQIPEGAAAGGEQPPPGHLSAPGTGMHVDPSEPAVSNRKVLRGAIVVDVQIDFTEPERGKSTKLFGPEGGSREEYPKANAFGGQLGGQGLSVFIGKDGRGDTNPYLEQKTTDFGANIDGYLHTKENEYDFVAYSIDYHPEGHCSFNPSATIDNPLPVVKAGANGQCEAEDGFQILWNPHCIQGSDGTKIIREVPRFRAKLENTYVTHGVDEANGVPVVQTWKDYSKRDAKPLPTIPACPENLFEHGEGEAASIDRTGDDDHFTVIYTFKGTNQNVDSYSAFQGNDKKHETGLGKALAELWERRRKDGYTSMEIDIFGVAYDVCVMYTAVDAFNDKHLKGTPLKVNFLRALSAPVPAFLKNGINKNMKTLATETQGSPLAETLSGYSANDFIDTKAEATKEANAGKVVAAEAADGLIDRLTGLKGASVEESDGLVYEREAGAEAGAAAAAVDDFDSLFAKLEAAEGAQAQADPEAGEEPQVPEEPVLMGSLFGNLEAVSAQAGGDEPQAAAAGKGAQAAQKRTYAEALRTVQRRLSVSGPAIGEYYGEREVKRLNQLVREGRIVMA